MKRQTAIFFYLIAGYVVLQFTWWAYHLLEVSSASLSPEDQRKQIIMITGEGLVFIFLLLLGLWKIRNSIQKEMLVSKRQNNFLLSITHELKTPLASNKLYLQTLLKRDNLEKEQQKELLRGAILENKRLEDMINNILTATQLETEYLKLNKDEVDFSKELTRLTTVWEQMHFPIYTDIEDNIQLNADMFVIETILSNLLENANKYAGEDAKITVYLKKRNQQIIWGVKDNGLGIPLEERKDIFNKFVRIGNEETRKQKGTGLGLFIVKNLVLIHGDKISYLENQPKGANFQITSY